MAPTPPTLGAPRQSRGAPREPDAALALAQGERRKSEQRTTREPPAPFDRIDERGRRRRQTADEHPAARQRGHSETRRIPVCDKLLDVGCETFAVERADDRDRPEVRTRLGKAEPLEGRIVLDVTSRLGRRRPGPATTCSAHNAGAAPQDEPVVDKPAVLVVDRNGAVEHGEPPRFAERDP